MNTPILLVGPWAYTGSHDEFQKVVQDIKKLSPSHTHVFTPFDIMIDEENEKSTKPMSQARLDHLGLRAWVNELTKRDYIVVTLNNWEQSAVCTKIVSIARTMNYTIEPVVKIIGQ